MTWFKHDTQHCCNSHIDEQDLVQIGTLLPICLLRPPTLEALVFKQAVQTSSSNDAHLTAAASP
jgi:hypothetical protein